MSVSFKSVSKALCLFVPLKTCVDGYPPLYLCTREIQPLPTCDLESSGGFHPFSLNYYLLTIGNEGIVPCDPSAPYFPKYTGKWVQSGSVELFSLP